MSDGQGMAEKFANNAISTLASGITNADVTLTVADASTFPTSGNFRIKVESELMLVTNVSGTTFTITRGIEGTTATSHTGGVDVQHILTVAALDQLLIEGRTIVTVGPTGSLATYITDGTNDEVEINNAITAVNAAGGGTVKLFPGTYNLANPVNLQSNVALRGSGPEVTKLAVATSFPYNTARWVVGCSGAETTGTPIALAVDAPLGTQNLTGTAGAELSAVLPSDYLFLRSEALWESVTTNTTKLGEFVKVLSVSGTTISIYGVTRSSYLVSDTANLYRMSFITDVAVSDLSITQLTTPGTVSTTQASVSPFISLQRVHRGSVTNCYLHDGDGPGITVYHSIGVTVEDNNIKNLTDNTASKYLGYAVLVGGASERVIVRGNKVSTVRHGVDAGTSLSNASVTNGYSVARGVLVTGNVVEHATNSCYSTHAGAEAWEFSGNVALNSLSYGFFMRGRGCRIIGNTVEFCGGGIGIGDTSFNSAGGSASGCLITGNTLRRIKTQSITSQYQAVGVLASTYALGQGILLGLTDNVVVSHNVITETDDAGIRLRQSAIRNQIIHNTIVDANLANTANIPGILIDGNPNGSTSSLSQSGTTTTLTGGTGFTAAHVGRNITISNSAANNNGTFVITSVVSSSSLTYTNASGTTDASGTVHYFIEGSTDNYIAENLVINRQTSDYDANTTTGHAKYAVRDAGTSGNIRNVYKNNTGIAMETGILSVNATSAYSAGNAATEGVPTKTKAGAPVDADYVATPSDGVYATDTTNNYGYVRSGGTWCSIPTDNAVTWQWVTGVSSPILTQADNTTNSAVAQNLTIRPQSATGTTSTGGSLNLAVGSGTSANGTVRFTNAAGTSALGVTPNPTGSTTLTFANTVTGVTFQQSSTSTSSGATFQISAQAATGDTFNGGTLGLSAGSASGATSGTGGSVNISSGTGITANGAINLRAGSTTAIALALNPTGTTSMSFVAGVTTVNIQQSITSTASGAQFNVLAQGSSFDTGTAGTLRLAGGNGTTNNVSGGSVFIDAGTPNGTGTQGSIIFRRGTTTCWTLVPSATAATSIQAANGATSVTISQADKTTNSAVGSAFTLQAQNATGTTSTGGALNLTSGTGTTAAGAVNLQTGGTTRFTVKADGTITVSTFAAQGIVQNDASGNLSTSPTITLPDTTAPTGASGKAYLYSSSGQLSSKDYVNNLQQVGQVAIALASDFTTTNATATSTNLAFSVGANDVWLIEVEGNVSSGDTAGVKFAVSTPAGATIEGNTFGHNTSTTNYVDNRFTGTGLGSTLNNGSAGTLQMFRIFARVKMGGTAGTITIQGASVTAGQTMTLKAGAWLKAVRVTEV